MLKKHILVILLFVSVLGIAQNTKSVVIDSVQIDADRYYGKDILGYDYFSKRNVLYKQKKSEKWEYKNLPLGKIHTIDFINPLKTLIFYKDFNSFVLLDNQLSEITKITLNDFNIVAQTCSVASQNRLWIYDNLNNQLLLLDYLNNKTTPINQPFKNTFSYYKSHYNYWIRISKENKIYSYDNYGRVSELGEIPEFDEILITDSGKILFSLNDNLYLYKNHTEKPELILSNNKPFDNFSFSDDILTIFEEKNYNELHHKITIMHIAVAGNIGAGKTTLTRLLAKHFKWEPHFEDVVDNPYLDDFYHQMERWSFNLQIYFFEQSFQTGFTNPRKWKKIIQDRTIYEDAYIFAPNLHDMGLMSNRDFQNYASLFELMENTVAAPDLLIYLRSSIPNLVGQIHKRGREYENSISIDYLSRLNERYEAWIQGYKKGNLLIIDVDNVNFVDNQEDLGNIINKIDAELNGLF